MDFLLRLLGLVFIGRQIEGGGEIRRDGSELNGIHTIERVVFL